MRSPLGVVIILGLFIVLALVSAATRAHPQDVGNDAILAEDDASITNAQPTFVLATVWRRTFLSTEAVAYERGETEKRSLLPTPLDIKDAGRTA